MIIAMFSPFSNLIVASCKIVFFLSYFTHIFGTHLGGWNHATEYGQSSGKGFQIIRP